MSRECRAAAQCRVVAVEYGKSKSCDLPGCLTADLDVYWIEVTAWHQSGLRESASGEQGATEVVVCGGCVSEMLTQLEFTMLG